MQPSAQSLALPAPMDELARLRGEINIDGSSTVFPITEAAALAFRDLAPGVVVHLGVSGTGGGFKKFCAGETLISDASRSINVGEIAACAAAGIDFIELPIAYDGISLVVHPDNDFAQCLTVAELSRIWAPAAEGQVLSWQDVRADWPARPLALYGPGGDSGTYDYFTEAIIGEAGLSRSDYIGSEDDYLIAQDVADNPDGMAFFGYTYLLEYGDALRAVAIDSGAGCVAPSAETIASGAYRPLSRPLFLYVRADALARPEARAFMMFYLDNAAALVQRAHAIPLSPQVYPLVIARASRQITGSVFQGGLEVNVSIEELLTLEGQN